MRSRHRSHAGSHKQHERQRQQQQNCITQASSESTVCSPQTTLPCRRNPLHGYGKRENGMGLTTSTACPVIVLQPVTRGSGWTSCGTLPRTTVVMVDEGTTRELPFPTSAFSVGSEPAIPRSCQEFRGRCLERCTTRSRAAAAFPPSSVFFTSRLCSAHGSSSRRVRRAIGLARVEALRIRSGLRRWVAAAVTANRTSGWERLA